MTNSATKYLPSSSRTPPYLSFTFVYFACGLKMCSRDISHYSDYFRNFLDIFVQFREVRKRNDKCTSLLTNSHLVIIRICSRWCTAEKWKIIQKNNRSLFVPSLGAFLSVHISIIFFQGNMSKVMLMETRYLNADNTVCSELSKKLPLHTMCPRCSLWLTSTLLRQRVTHTVTHIQYSKLNQSTFVSSQP